MSSAKQKSSRATYITQLLKPVRANQFQPLLFKGFIFVVVLSLMLLVVAVEVFDVRYIKPEQPRFSETQTNLLEIANEERSKYGLQPLLLDERLINAAEAKMQHTLDEDYWAHESPTGLEIWELIDSSRVSYTSSAEVLARNFKSQRAIVDGWLASKSHREAILNPDFTHVGFSQREGEGKLRAVGLLADLDLVRGVSATYSIENPLPGKLVINVVDMEDIALESKVAAYAVFIASGAASMASFVMIKRSSRKNIDSLQQKTVLGLSVTGLVLLLTLNFV